MDLKWGKIFTSYLTFSALCNASLACDSAVSFSSIWSQSFWIYQMEYWVMKYYLKNKQTKKTKQKKKKKHNKNKNKKLCNIFWHSKMLSRVIPSTIHMQSMCPKCHHIKVLLLQFIMHHFFTIFLTLLCLSNSKESSHHTEEDTQRFTSFVHHVKPFATQHFFNLKKKIIVMYLVRSGCNRLHALQNLFIITLFLVHTQHTHS